MNKIVLFNKPFHVMCQFTDPAGRITLADFINEKNYYAAGRLDYDSEGLLILTNNGALQNAIANPTHENSLGIVYKTYLVQLEGSINESAINRLRNGVELKDGITKPAKVECIDSPLLWERIPPIRERKNIPTSWIQIKIAEGKNRQVRRMTAAVGFPTLRLVRTQIGPWSIGNLSPGECAPVEVEDKWLPASSSLKRSSTSLSNDANHKFPHGGRPQTPSHTHSKNRLKNRTKKKPLSTKR